jgi:hypothetical protein
VWFDSIDIPQEVLNGQDEGRLVVFAGAGISIPPPSNLPSFPGLVRALELQFGYSWDKDKDQEDRFLGRLDDLGIPVHSSVKSLIDDPNSEPTELHSCVMQLFARIDQVRIVTTNFDRHFSTAASGLGIGDLEHYKAPALPLGNDFSGIVNLHGSVDGREEDLVLTDRDFARAYITEGWARRFLVQLFEKWVVLFVGFSHGDIVLEYLARGIPPRNESNRFVLVHQDDPDKWNRLGITPILYPTDTGVSNTHQPLTDSVARWVEVVRTGSLGHAKRIREIVSQGPPIAQREDVDYLRYIIRRPAHLAEFCNAATSSEWVRWANDNGELDLVFDTNATFEAREKILADWWAVRCVDDFHEMAPLLKQNGGKLHPIAWNCLAHELTQSYKDLPHRIREQFAFTLIETHQAGNGGLFLEGLLRVIELPEDHRVAGALFDHIFDPVPALVAGLTTSSSESWTFRGAHRSDAVDIGEEWLSILRSNLSVLALPVIPSVTRGLERIASMYSVQNQVGELIDPTTFGRRAIEPHEQDKHRDGIDILVDTARVAGEWLGQNQPETGKAITDVWVASAVPILRRLAIHCRGFIDGELPDDTLSWILEKDLVYQYPYKHEVFELLKKVYPQASHGARSRFLEATGLTENGGMASD